MLVQLECKHAKWLEAASGGLGHSPMEAFHWSYFLWVSTQLANLIAHIIRGIRVHTHTTELGQHGLVSPDNRTCTLTTVRPQAGFISPGVVGERLPAIREAIWLGATRRSFRVTVGGSVKLNVVRLICESVFPEEDLV